MVSTKQPLTYIPKLRAIKMASNSNSLTLTPNPTPPDTTLEIPILAPNPQILDMNPNSPPYQSSHSTPNSDNATQDATPSPQKHTNPPLQLCMRCEKEKKNQL